MWQSLVNGTLREESCQGGLLKMTVMELLSTISGVESIGLYTSEGDVIDPEVTIISVLPYLNCKVAKVSLWPTEISQPGSTYRTIVRACIGIYDKV